MNPGILLVLAHPDDESFIGGAVLSQYAKRGIRTGLLCLTDGQAGRIGLTGKPPLTTRERAGELRRQEVQEAARVLGIEWVSTPGLMDGGLKDVPDEKGSRLTVRAVREFRPDILISFGPEGGASGHSDHVAASRWSEMAWDLSDDSTYEPERLPHTVSKLYWITHPEGIQDFRGITCSPITTEIELTPDTLALKREAFSRHASQQDHLETFNRFLEFQAGREYFHLAKSRVGYREIGLERDLLERIGIE